MSKFALISGLSGVGAAGAVAAGMAMGMIEMPDWMRAMVSKPAAAVQDTPTETATAKPAPPTTAAPTASPVEEPTATPPVFDLVRSEPDGSTQVAGAGEPGHRVEIIVNGEVAAETVIGGDGKFFVMLDLADPSVGNILSLASIGGDSRLTSDQDVIIAPAPRIAGAPAADTSDTPVDTAAAPVVASTTDPVETASLTIEPAGTSPRVPGGQGPSGLSDLTGEGAAPTLRTGDTNLPGKSVQPGGPAVATAPDAAGIDVDTRTSAGIPLADTAGPAALIAPGTGTATTAVAAADPALAARSTGNQQGSAPSADRAEPPAILLATPRGVEVLQGSELAPGEVALDAISYDAAGDVLLSGRGDERAFVRIYLDNTPITTSRIPADGRWRVELPEVNAGTYTLRVDQIDLSGVVLARVESPFLRESPAALEAATSGDKPITSITVQPGNTLWAISEERYGDGVEYVKVFRANRDRIRNPDLIYPGQIFDLPE
jgi:nucleoid-associated protein YgaU